MRIQLTGDVVTKVRGEREMAGRERFPQNCLTSAPICYAHGKVDGKLLTTPMRRSRKMATYVVINKHTIGYQDGLNLEK